MALFHGWSRAYEKGRKTDAKPEAKPAGGEGKPEAGKGEQDGEKKPAEVRDSK